MKKFFKKLKSLLPTRRRIIQLYAALLTNANLKGFATGRIYQGATKYVCVPGLNCYSCPGAVGACPLGTLQNSLAASKTRLPAYIFGILILMGMLLGRTICGFLCPFGLVQDLLYKVKTPKLKKNCVTRVLSYGKYVTLACFVVLLPLVFASPAFCKYICPAGTLGGAMGLLFNPANEAFVEILGGLFTWKFAVLVSVLLASIFIFRPFCRFLCPLGAIYGFFGKLALLGVKLDKKACTDCGLCVAACKMDIRRVGDRECIHCGECISVCPTKAISWKGSQFFLHPAETSPVVVGNSANETPNNGVKIDLTTPLPTFVKDEKTADTAQTAAFTEGVASKCENPSACSCGERVEGCETPLALAAKNALDASTQTAFVSAQENAKTEQTDGAVARSSENAEVRRYKKRRKTLAAIAWAVATAILIGSLVYFNFVEKDTPPLAVGNAVGEECIDFTVPLYNREEGETFTLSQNRGKVTVINFWYTSCTGCKAEMPHFNKVAQDYQDVTFIAIHGNFLLDTVQPFLDTYQDDFGTAWNDYAILFARDVGITLEDGSTRNVYDALGGGNAWPFTLIVDANGVITFKTLKELGESELRAELNKALQK